MDTPTSYNVVTRLRETNLKTLKIKDKKEITVMSKMMEKGYEVKHAEQKVICTKKFLLDSSDMMNAAFEQMCKLRAMFPDYSFEQYAIEKNANKQTYGKRKFNTFEGFPNQNTWFFGINICEDIVCVEMNIPGHTDIHRRFGKATFLSQLSKARCICPPVVFSEIFASIFVFELLQPI